jgi:hypothetical protein
MELKKWDESQLAKYTTSLTEGEKKFLSVINSGNKVKDCPLQEFKKMIVFASVTYGVTQMPSPEEEKLLYHAIHSSYPHNTIEEVNYALFLNATGKHWERVQCFNLISIPFICDCMNKYIEWARKMNNDLKKKELPKPVPATSDEDTKAVDWIAWLERDKASTNKGFAVGLARIVITKLYNLQVLSDDDIPDNEWKKFEVQTLKNIKVKQRNFIKVSIKAEFMACLYEYLLKDEMLFNTVIQRLKQKTNEQETNH